MTLHDISVIYIYVYIIIYLFWRNQIQMQGDWEWLSNWTTLYEDFIRFYCITEVRCFSQPKWLKNCRKPVETHQVLKELKGQLNTWQLVSRALQFFFLFRWPSSKVLRKICLDKKSKGCWVHRCWGLGGPQNLLCFLGYRYIRSVLIALNCHVMIVAWPFLNSSSEFKAVPPWLKPASALVCLQPHNTN